MFQFYYYFLYSLFSINVQRLLYILAFCVLLSSGFLAAGVRVSQYACVRVCVCVSMRVCVAPVAPQLPSPSCVCVGLLMSWLSVEQPDGEWPTFLNVGPHASVSHSNDTCPSPPCSPALFIWRSVTACWPVASYKTWWSYHLTHINLLACNYSLPFHLECYVSLYGADLWFNIGTSFSAWFNKERLYIYIWNIISFYLRGSIMAYPWPG
jgi:hypothetical protein